MPAQTPTPTTAKVSFISKVGNSLAANGKLISVQKAANQKTIPSGEELVRRPRTARYANAENTPEINAIVASMSMYCNDGETIRIVPIKETRIQP